MLDTDERFSAKMQNLNMRFNVIIIASFINTAGYRVVELYRSYREATEGGRAAGMHITGKDSGDVQKM